MVQSEQSQISCLLRKLSRAFVNAKKSVTVTADYTMGSEGTVLIGTAAANAADITLPNPTLYLDREIVVANYSGAAQNLLSHDGTSLTIKTSTGAATATFALASPAAATTAGARYRFKAIGTSTSALWYLIGF